MRTRRRRGASSAPFGADASLCLSELGPASSHGGEWLWSSVAPVGPIAPRAPWLIWVLGPVAGDVMVDGSPRGKRLRPLGLLWSAARRRVSQKLRELAGRLAFIFELAGLAEAIGGLDQLTGSSASGPSAESVWNERRASLRAIVIVARVCERPRAFSSR